MALTKVTGQVIKNTTDVTVGVLTVTNTLAVGGTVSIGGTLTYEDVTNVDAVGLITARNGIVVGSGITLSKDGDIFATGISTFSEGFAGDVLIDDKIVHRGDTTTAIRFPAVGTISFECAGEEILKIGKSSTELLRISGPVDASTQQEFGIGIAVNDEHTHPAAQITFKEYDASDSKGDLLFYTRGTNDDVAPTERFRIDSSGRILIGTTTEGFSGADNLTIEDSGHCGITIRSGSDDDGQISFSDATSGDGEYAGQIVYDHTDNFMMFRTNGGNERLRITANGLVIVGSTTGDHLLSAVAANSATPRIGITNPDNDENFNVSSYHDSNGMYVMLGVNSKFDANGNFATDTTAHRASAITMDARNSGSIQFHTTEAGSNASERVRIDSIGQVGINTSSPTCYLEVVSSKTKTWTPTTQTELLVERSGNCIMSIVGNNDADCILNFSDSDDENPGAIDYDHATDNMIFRVNGANRAKFLTDGRFVLGSPTINTTVDYSVVTTGRVQSDGTYATTSSSSANVRIGSSGLLSRSTSSARYKKDITDATWGLADVLKLKPKTFKSNATGEDADDNTYGGFIAEDVHDIGLTNFVEYNSDNQPDAIHYGNMVALMTKAIQEQQEKIETLEAEVAALKSS